MKSVLTICRAPRSIPAILYDNIQEGLATGRALGFDGVEINGPLQELDWPTLRRDLADSGLELAAVMTGGVAQQGLFLSSADEQVRAKAFEGVSSAIELAAGSGALVSIGQVIGPASGDAAHDAAARQRATSQVRALARRASVKGVRLAVEPMNRYLKPLLPCVDDAVALVDEVGEANVGLMLDVFHMNIEETSIEQAIRKAGKRVFYVQLSDSNRRAPGDGHIDFESIKQSLAAVGYDGWISAEILPLPDSHSAAARWREAYGRLFATPHRFSLDQAQALRSLLNEDPVFKERAAHFVGSVALAMGGESWAFWFNAGQIVRVQAGVPPEAVDFTIGGPIDEWAAVFKGEKHLLHAMNPYLGRLRLSGNALLYAGNVRPVFYLVSQLQKVSSHV